MLKLSEFSVGQILFDSRYFFNVVYQSCDGFIVFENVLKSISTELVHFHDVEEL